MSIIPAGFTRLDNETDVMTLLSLPNALVQPYLFLLTRSRLNRAGAHWGEVAAAINRSQSQTHAALRGLKERGLAEESAGLWIATRGKSTGNPPETHREAEQKPTGFPTDSESKTHRESVGNPPETHRKPAMDESEKADQDNENENPKEGTEGTEGKKELKDKNTPLTPQGVPGGEAAEPGAGQTPAPDARPDQVDQSPAGDVDDPGHDGKDVPRRRAAPPALPDDLAALPGLPEAWARWTKYAREVRLKLTESVADAQFSKLRRLHADGWDLPHIVQHAIENNWKSFFPIRGEQPRQNLKLTPPEPEKPRTREEWLS